MPYVLKEDDKYCFVTFSWQMQNEENSILSIHEAFKKY